MLRFEPSDLGAERPERPVGVGIDPTLGVGVHGEGLGDLGEDAVLVHHQPIRLLGRGPVHPGDGLEQLGFLDQPVEVDHLGLGARRTRVSSIDFTITSASGSCFSSAGPSGPRTKTYPVTLSRHQAILAKDRASMPCIETYQSHKKL